MKKEQQEAGNPLAAYAEMLRLEPEYLRSKLFARVYPEVRAMYEEAMGVPLAGVRAMSLPTLRGKVATDEKTVPARYRPEDAVAVVAREARRTRLVIYGEEHHLPQTRSLYEPLLRALWREGYRYLAGETFEDEVMKPGFKYPTYDTGVYTKDPVYADAVRAALRLGYKLVAYEAHGQGPAGDMSYRDRTEAENLKARVFDRDPGAKVFVIVGRSHAAESTASDGWTPMASVLKRLTGIDPLTLYAPTMTERLTREEEDPRYVDATSRGLVRRPTIFVDAAGGMLGSPGAFDAYVFFPRTRLIAGRPDWMVRELGRRRVPIPARLRDGRGLRLVQAFEEGEQASAIAVDQVLIKEGDDAKALMLPTGRFWLRTIEPDGAVVGEARVRQN
ncbi:MAG: hypothetical protein M3379_04225 [Acidobacteriota bacterium]|nr:hypothetical protein [Acidobacteriota bacterium]